MMEIGIPFLLECATVEECVALCAELGCSFVELNMEFPPCRRAMEHPEELRALSEKTGVGFTIHMDESCDPFTINGIVRKAWLESLRDTIERAKIIGAKILNMHVGKGSYVTLPDKRVFLYACYPEEFIAAAHDLKRICEEACAGSDTRVSIENTTGFPPHEQQALEILLASPVIGLTMDIGHCNEVNNIDEPFYFAHEHKLFHMHFHDGRGSWSHMPLGEGEIDLRGRLDFARRAGARLLLEVKTADALRKSVPVLRKMMQE